MIPNPAPPQAIIENNKILNAYQLRAYWRERHRKEYLLSRAWRDAFTPVKSEVDSIEERLNNLEAISAEPGQVPKQYEEKLREMQGHMIYLENKINEKQIKKGGQASSKSSIVGIEL